METFKFILDIIVIVFGLLGISSFVGQIWKRKADRIVQRQEDKEKATDNKIKLAEAVEEKEKMEKFINEYFSKQMDSFALMVGKVVEEKIQPLQKDINIIKEDLALDREATVVNLRVTMKTLRDRYKKQGYAEASDKATWLELYNKYANMGGNHFHEYVDQWKEDVEDLPKMPH